MKTLILAGLLGLTLVGCGSAAETVYLENVKYVAKESNVTALLDDSDEKILESGKVVCKNMKKIGAKNYAKEVVFAQLKRPSFEYWHVVSLAATDYLCREYKTDYREAVGNMTYVEFEP